jgi:hypothetical protein
MCYHCGYRIDSGVVAEMIRSISFSLPDKPLDRKSPESRYILLNYAQYFGLVNVHKDGHHVRMSDGLQNKMIEYALENQLEPEDIDHQAIAWIITRFVLETIRDMPILIALRMVVRSGDKNKVWYDLCDLMLKIHQAYKRPPPSDNSTSHIKSNGREL